jgi:O-antigen ligase
MGGIDRAQSPRKSPGRSLLRWGRQRPVPLMATLCALAMCFRLTFLIRRRPGPSFATVDAFAMLEVLITLVSLCVIVLGSSLPVLLRRLRRTGVVPVLIFFAVGCLSALWSSLPAFSAYRSVASLSQLLLAFLILNGEESWRNAEVRLVQLCLIIMAMQVFSLGVAFGASALFSHSNTYPTSAAMLACYCIGESLRMTGNRRRTYQLAFASVVSFALVVIGTSSGSILATAAGILVVAMLSRRSGLVVLTVIMLILAGVLFSHDTLISVAAPGKDEDQILTLTGRVTLWSDYWHMFLQRPRLGYGYAVASRIGKIYTTNTHNIVFGVVLGCGLVGASFFFFGIAHHAFGLLLGNLRSRPGSLGSIGALTAAIVNGMTKGFIGEAHFPETFVFFLLYLFGALYCVSNEPLFLRPRRLSRSQMRAFPQRPLRRSRRRERRGMQA